MNNNDFKRILDEKAELILIYGELDFRLFELIKKFMDKEEIQNLSSGCDEASEIDYEKMREDLEANKRNLVCLKRALNIKNNYEKYVNKIVTKIVMENLTYLTLLEGLIFTMDYPMEDLKTTGVFVGLAASLYTLYELHKETGLLDNINKSFTKEELEQRLEEVELEKSEILDQLKLVRK